MATIGAFGYAASGLFYVVLTALLLSTWRGHRIGTYLIIASAVSAIWGVLLAIHTSAGTIHPLLLGSFEWLRVFAWICFLVKLVSLVGVRGLLTSLSVATCLAVGGGLCYLALRGAANVGEVIDLGRVLIPGGLVIALLGLVLIEQLYRNSSADSRRSLKPLVLGIGGLFAYDLFLYSQGVLLNAIDPTTWAARGLVNLFFIPMIAIAARRNTDWEVRIFVSRQVIFYSTTLVAAGVYLLLMSFGGYLIVRYGGSWGALARVVFFVGAAFVLLSLLFSNTLRARVKVFLNKHFFHNKYDYRVEWLNLVSTLADFDNEATPDVAVKALAQVIDSPAGVIWTRDDANSVFRLTGQLETADEFPDIPFDDPLVRFIEKDGWLVDLDELSREPDRYGGLQLPEWLSARDSTWLVVPLRSSNALLGLILLMRAPGPPQLNYEDRDLLKTIGTHIAVHLSQARSDSLLAEARQFEAYNRLTAFLMHDLNNLIAQQSLIVANAEKHKRKPEFVDDAISTIAGSVARMKDVMRQLKSGGSDKSSKLTELRFVVSTAVDRCSGRKPVPTIDTNDVDVKVAIDAEEFTMILTHLIRNAQDASTTEGNVSVSIRAEDGVATVVVADSGEGMSTDFIRNRLFRPFDSTKGNQGMGIGAYQARDFARKMGGQLDVESTPGVGTVVTMTIPAGDL